MTVEFVINNWYLFAIAAGIVVMLLMDPIRNHFSTVRSVSALQLPQLLREDAVIVDVSEPNEFKKGHIPKSLNIPLKKLNDQIDTFKKKKVTNVIIACRTGNRSSAAARVLTKHGFENVFTLSGGLLSWEKENLPMDKG